MSSIPMHSLLNIAPQILKTTASQVNQFELPCPTFSGLIKNGSKFMPNEWTIGRTGDVSCFLAHVSFKSFASVPRCDRAIYLTLNKGQNSLQEQNSNGLVFDCEELYEKRAGKVKKKKYTTTVEYLGDLLALLFNQEEDEDEDEDEEQEEKVPEKNGEGPEDYEDSWHELAPERKGELTKVAKNNDGQNGGNFRNKDSDKSPNKSAKISANQNKNGIGEEETNNGGKASAEDKRSVESDIGVTGVVKGAAKKSMGKVTKKSMGKRKTGGKIGAKSVAKTTISAGIARATFAKQKDNHDSVNNTADAALANVNKFHANNTEANEKNLERDIDMDNLRVKRELDVDDDAVDAEIGMEMTGEFERETKGEMTMNGNYETKSNGDYETNANGEEGELRVDIVSSRVTTLTQDNGVISHMHPVVRLEAMQDLNEYLEEQMAKGDERRQKQFHVRVEEEDSYQDGILNDGAFSTDGLYQEAAYDEMQSEYVDTPYDTIPVGPNAYAPKTLPTDILERWSKLQREVDGKYSCFMCAYQNAYHCRIKTHLFSHFEDPNKKTPQVKKGSGSRLKCGKCQRLFTQSKDLKRHAHDHMLKQSFQCPECSFIYGRQSELTRHLRIDHGIIPEPRCQECGKLFKTRTSMKQHIRKLHRGERPACTYCGRKFYSKYSLNTHMATHQKVFMETFRHTAEQDESGRWKCNQCGRDFKLKNSLKIHAMSHLDLRPFKCSLCQKSFTSASSLKFHQDIHTGTKRFSCKYCGQQFRQSASLKNHINRHENTFPHVCQHCEKGFNSKSDKDKHEALHIRKVMELQIDPNTGEMAYKEKMEVLDQLPNRATNSLIPPKCHVCEKLFKSHSILRNHIMIHTGEKPYKCESCGQSFNQIANLSRHRRRQVCKNPLLSCDICGKVFKKEWNLEVHKRTHLPNAKPTAKPTPIPKPKLNTRCTICLRKFSNNMALRGHMKSHKKSIEPVQEADDHISSTQYPTHLDTITADQQLANDDEQIIASEAIGGNAVAMQ